MSDVNAPLSQHQYRSPNESAQHTKWTGVGRKGENDRAKTLSPVKAGASLFKDFGNCLGHVGQPYSESRETDGNIGFLRVPPRIS